MKRIFFSVWSAFLVLSLGCVEVCAQARAQISGTAKDQSGAVLPGVEITVTQTETGITRNTVTNETGSYVLSNLALGPYRLEAALPGFRTYAQTGIVLQVNSSPVINVLLEVGQVAETVEVQANAALVETRNSTVGTVIENERILELPLNGREVVELITLAGAAVQTGSRGILGNWISVAGGLGFGLEWNLDGANHIDFTSGAGMPMPFPDALQEFKVETSGVTAQRGSAAGVGAVTKAGTNELHGDLFEFVRNDLFNARSYFATRGSTLKRHQFGGTLGGPVVKNKMFAFGGYQGTTLRQDPADTRSFVPTPAMIAGDWTAFASPACNAGRQINLRAPFVNNRIDPSLYSKAAMNLVSRIPKTDNPCGELTYGRKNDNNNWQVIGKIDYQATAKHSLFGRYMGTHLSNPSPFKFTPDNFLNTSNGNTEFAQSLALGSTYLVSPAMVNSLRLAFNRVAQWRLGQKYFNNCALGINVYCGYIPANMSMTVTGGFSLGGTHPTDNRYFVNGYQLNDDVSVVKGTHQMSFGGNLMYGWSYSNSYSVAIGVFQFNGQELGLGMADLFLGRPSQFQQGAPGNHQAKQIFFSIYGTDTWKMTPRLTLNYGMRWEPYLPQWIPNGIMYNFDENRFHQGIKSTVFKNAPAGFYYPGDPGFIGKSGQYKNWFQFAPRTGLAWDVNGDGRTSVRASYAIGYDFVSLDWRRDANGSAPWGNRTTLLSPAGGFENPWLGYPGGNPFPVVLDASARFAPYGNFLTAPYRIHTPRTASWNLSVQRQVSSDWLVSASYMGSLTYHMWTQKALNPGIYLPGGACTLNGVTYSPCSSTGNVNQRRKFSIEKPQEGQFLGAMADFDDGGTQDYHGMLLSVQRRVAQGTTASMNYTLSHCIGDYADLHSMGPAAEETYTIVNNRDADRGNCNGDRRHVFNLTAVGETPQFANSTMRMLATGWRLSGIYRLSSGSPINVVAGTDRALTGINLQRGNQILTDPYGDKSGGPLTNWLNRAAFDVPATGTVGNVGRNSARAPKTWSFDIALSRVFQVRESQRLEFRAEAYNLTNSFRPIAPTSGGCASGSGCAPLSSNTFGIIRNAYDPRIMQFALKYVF